ncbi:MAG: hypothetical protein HY721_06670 [Planctomycetes bacterium]|nr:hypothetical protein [Planctomycetota bacterium]
MARNGLEPIEVEAAVCGYFCRGLRAEEVSREMLASHGVKLTRQEPYRILSLAGKHNRLRYVPPQHDHLRQKIRERHGAWLRRVEVVSTALYEHVTEAGAHMLLDLVRDLAQPPLEKKVVRIGFSGGNTMRKVARCFADLLRKDKDGLPQTIVFHALVSALELKDPANDPNGFFTYLWHDPTILVETDFVLLPTGLVVDPQRFQQVWDNSEVQRARELAQDLDLICTSASCWLDDHGPLKRYMTDSEECRQGLLQQGIRGDMMFLPVGSKGPIDATGMSRAFTLLQLDDVARLLATRGTQVLLVLGPCGKCARPKTEILETLLGLEKHHLSHLVTDSKTAAPLFKNGEWLKTP